MGLGSPHDQKRLILFRRLGGDAYKLGQKKRAHKLGIVIPENCTVPLFDVIEALAERGTFGKLSNLLAIKQKIKKGEFC